MERSSEWHEQVEFSELYFKETMQCREAQRESEEAWAQCLLSKISFAGGVMKEEDIKAWCSKVENALSSFYMIKRKHPFEWGKIMNVKNQLRTTLRTVEWELDTKVNKVMPFLNIKPKTSLKGF